MIKHNTVNTKMSNRKDKDYSSHHQHYQNHRRHESNDVEKAVENFLLMESLSTSANMSLPKIPNRTENPSTSTSTSPPQKDLRLLRCFCGCSQLTYEQVEKFSMMNVNGIVNNDVSNNLLKTFLKIGHRTDKSNALLQLECYEFATKMSQDLGNYREYLDDLIELCPSFLWEQRLNDACDEGSPEMIRIRLEDVLNALKKECLCNIESDNDFTRFKRELLRKIGK